jgi:hypothetical protein
VGSTDDIAFIKRLNREFNGFGQVYKIAWKDDKTRQKAINIISGASRKKEDYLRVFKLLMREKISKKRGHPKKNNPNKLWAANLIAAKEIMNVLYNVRKKNGIEYFEIEEFIVCDYYIDRENITNKVRYR